MDMFDFSKLEDYKGATFEDVEFREGLMPPLKPRPGQDAQPMEPETGGAMMYALPMKYQYRRAFSESSLLDAIGAPGFNFEKGMCYNFMTKGDVDALSFMKAIMRQQNVKKAIVSTWCVDMNDILQLKKWVDEGRIGMLHLFLGEIYTTGRHGIEIHHFRKTFEGYDNVKVVVARNHSKVMCGRGEKFDFLIQTSANINTNPRIESTCVIIPNSSQEEDMFAFYEAFFKTVNNIRRYAGNTEI